MLAGDDLHGRSGFDLRKLRADDLLHQIVHFFIGIPGLPVALARVTYVVVAFIADFGRFLHGSVRQELLPDAVCR